MAALVQTIAVIDKSGKAVKNSKHLINVFKEAKAAYLERKTILAGGGDFEPETKPHKSSRRAIRDDKSSASSRSQTRSRHGSNRPSSHRRLSGESLPHQSQTIYPSSQTIYPSSQNRHAQDLTSQCASREDAFRPGTLMRRHSTYDDDHDSPPPRPLALRSMTTPVPPSPHIDMDLAYGPIPPPLPVARRGADEAEFKGLVHKVKRLLEEADCLQYSASAIIMTLQRNPDAMAAVALTLAEISNIVTKMAPNVLTALKGSSPAVFSLLASPQFMIAGGVAVGVTIVAFGGFKIIKKIQAKNAVAVPAMDEMMEIGGDVNRIDNWRRGIAEVEGHSVGTSVDGEFITPQAAELAKLNLRESRPSHTRRRASSGDIESTGGGRSKSDHTSETRSKASSKPCFVLEPKTSSRRKKKEKVKSPSPLRLMFN